MQAEREGHTERERESTVVAEERELQCSAASCDFLPPLHRLGTSAVEVLLYCIACCHASPAVPSRSLIRTNLNLVILLKSTAFTSSKQAQHGHVCRSNYHKYRHTGSSISLVTIPSREPGGLSLRRLHYYTQSPSSPPASMSFPRSPLCAPCCLISASARLKLDCPCSTIGYVHRYRWDGRSRN